MNDRDERKKSEPGPFLRGSLCSLSRTDPGRDSWENPREAKGSKHGRAARKGATERVNEPTAVRNMVQSKVRGQGGVCRCISSSHSLDSGSR
jgi:hypothetical protein